MEVYLSFLEFYRLFGSNSEMTMRMQSIKYRIAAELYLAREKRGDGWCAICCIEG